MVYDAYWGLFIHIIFLKSSLPVVSTTHMINGKVWAGFSLGLSMN